MEVTADVGLPVRDDVEVDAAVGLPVEVDAAVGLPDRDDVEVTADVVVAV